MKILIDCRPIERNNITSGTAVYIQNLILAISNADKKNQYYTLFHQKENCPKKLINLGDNFKIIAYNSFFNSFNYCKAIFNHFFLGLWIKFKIKPSLCFFPYSQSPFLFFSPLVLTAHDFAIYKNQKWFAPGQWFAKKIITSLSFRRAKKIIAVSKNTSKDLEKFMQIDQKKIKVIYEGVNNKPKILINPDQVLRKFQVKNNFLLFIGTLEPRKNLIRLLKAFQKLEKDYPNFQLVIAGKKGWKYEGIFTTYKKLNLQNKVIFTGLVKESEKWVLLEKCKIFVYPSLYEGFGLPILEAQKSKAPVLCGNRGSLPEITNNSALLINPYSVDEIYLGMKKILEDENFKNHLIANGSENMKRFSWEKAAQETIEVFREILEKA